MSGNHSSEQTCEFPGCGNAMLAKGLCNGHYNQKWRGIELRPLKSKRSNDEPLSFGYLEVPCLISDFIGPCHEWPRCRNKDGYGVITIKRKSLFVHRYIWERVNGPIPEGLVIDHKCRNRACFNVDHLRVVTIKVNNTENSLSPSAINAARTRCKNGHEFTEENTIATKTGRGCRICMYARNHVYRQKKKRLAQS